MSTRKCIAIVGGGVAGLSPAWQLAKRGWEVHLFERDRLGGGASSRAAGMLAPVSEATFEEEELLQLGLRSLELYPRWVEELAEHASRNLDYRRWNTLIVAVDRDDAEALERLYGYYRRLDLDVKQLSGRQVRKREPGLTPNINYGLLPLHDHQIDPGAMIEAMGRAFITAGGHLHEQTPVDAIELGDDGVEALRLEDGARFETHFAVLAAGAWSSKIDGLPDRVLPHLRPIRGQVVAVALGDPPLIQHVIRAPDAYLVPRGDGRLIVGSTMEERGFDDRLTAGGVLDILTGAWEAVPGIYDAPILDMGTGFRPVTMANEPVVGATNIDGLYLSVGHGRGGILMTPATGYGLAQIIDEQEIPSWLKPFSP